MSEKFWHSQNKIGFPKHQLEIQKFVPTNMKSNSFFLLSQITGGFGDFYTMKRSGMSNEFLLAKFLKYMEAQYIN